VRCVGWTMTPKLDIPVSMRAAMFGLALAGLSALLMRTYLGWAIRGELGIGLPSNALGKVLVVYLACYIVWVAWRFKRGLPVLND